MGKTDRIILDEDGVLMCPECNSNNLHQESCEIVFRDEDKDGILTVVQNGHVEVGNIASSELRGRRDVMYINFSCEHCDGIKRVMVEQYKGLTLMLWVD